MNDTKWLNEISLRKIVQELEKEVTELIEKNKKLQEQLEAAQEYIEFQLDDWDN